ncbi:MAG TPA: DUF962 domain-containing protein [Thiotrichaceae bacterium]|nr:DUF962 domain-containing protein [Thiotrichaceae bacterium]
MNLDKFISDYDSYHKDPLNIKIHVVCVPLIILSVVGILNAIPISWGHIRIGHIVCSLYFSYYIFFARTYLPPCFVMFTALIAVDFLLAKLSTQLYLSIHISLFIICWVLQFWGHKKEGNKPAFLGNKETGIHSIFMAPILVIRHIRIIF